MTADASSRSAGELPAEMACCAVESRMGAGEGEACEFQVIKLRSQPVVHAMTLRAVGRKLQLSVIRLSRLELVRMTAIAIGRHGGVITHRTILVAGITIDSGVSTH